MEFGTFQIVAVILILIFVIIRAVVSVLYAQGKYMQDADMKIDEWPDLGPIYVRHFLRLLFLPRKLGPKHRIKKVTMTVKKPHQTTPKDHAAFTKLCQPQLIQKLIDDSSGGDALGTILFLTVKTFRLQLTLLGNTHYPLSAIGSVMSSYRALLLRRIEGSEPLTIRAELDSQFRFTERGNVEIDTYVQATDAAGKLVWTDVTTFTIKMGKKAKRAPIPPAKPEPDLSAFPHTQEWQWSEDAGPSFAKLNGDRNPIHMRPAFAALFGFRSSIAHGQHVLARVHDIIGCSAHWGSKGAQYPQAISATFKRPAFLPGQLKCSWGETTTSQTLEFQGLDVVCQKPVEFVVSEVPHGRALVLGYIFGQGKTTKSEAPPEATEDSAKVAEAAASE
ncbi:hypothetical protein WJX73_010650 [Symbiochloris irregularis]|uniref:MaoC-like domain-containing protein n=1 Tax=Symbiochloris irregularis TaxID=706552 RepID=A0AAW1NXW7_9CHLO